MRHRLARKYIQTGLIVLYIISTAILIPVYLLGIAPSEASETEKKLFLEFKLKEVINVAGYLITFLCSSLGFYFLIMIPTAVILAAITWLQQ